MTRDITAGEVSFGLSRPKLWPGPAPREGLPRPGDAPAALGGDGSSAL